MKTASSTITHRQVFQLLIPISFSLFVSFVKSGTKPIQLQRDLCTLAHFEMVYTPCTASFCLSDLAITLSKLVPWYWSTDLYWVKISSILSLFLLAFTLQFHSIYGCICETYSPTHTNETQSLTTIVKKAVCKLFFVVLF